jgi:hypothetical protein
MPRPVAVVRTSTIGVEGVIVDHLPSPISIATLLSIKPTNQLVNSASAASLTIDWFLG